MIANFLFDPTTYQVLGLVDYDYSHTGHPLHKFFFSSFSVSYCVISTETDPSVATALFYGFPSPLPPSERVGAIRPSTVVGAEKIANVYGFIAEVCPFFFSMERWLPRISEEKLRERIREHGNRPTSTLAKWGY